MNKQILFATTSLVLAGFLAGIVVFQQFEIVSSDTQNNDLSFLVSQMEQENDSLKEDYFRLNSTYFQLLSSLQTSTGLLNSTNLELSSLQQDYSNLLDSYNNLSAKVEALRNSIAQLSQELGGYEGIFILNYTYVYTYEDPYHHYSAEIELYNALESAIVTVKVYGAEGTFRPFTYSMFGYSKRTFVETWDTGLEGGYDFSLITIDNVERVQTLKLMTFALMVVPDIAHEAASFASTIPVPFTFVVDDRKQAMTHEQFRVLAEQGEVIPGFGRLQAHEPAVREAIVSQRFEHFKQLAGYYPNGFFTFIPDTHTLNYLYDNYAVDYCVGYVWDQYKIDNMTMRGGWQAPYYASRDHALVPSKQDGVVVFPWFTCDWIERYWESHRYNTHPVDNFRLLKEISFTYLRELIDKTINTLDPFGYAQVSWEYGWAITPEYARGYFLNITNQFPETNFLTLNEACQWFKSHHPKNPEYTITFPSWFNNTVEWLWSVDYRIARVNGKVYSFIDYEKQTTDKYLTSNGFPIDNSLRFELDGLGGGDHNPTPIDKPISFSEDLKQFPDFAGTYNK